MTISGRDKRALQILAGAAVIALLVNYWPQDTAEVVKPVDTPEMAEKRLAQVRRVAAMVPAKQEAFRQASEELGVREKGVIQADTAAQAQAQVLQVLRRVSRNQGPAVEIRSVELGQPRPFGEEYGEVSVSISMDCRIEQLLNFLADISAQPELLATNEVRIGTASGKEKVMPVRLTIAGVVPRKLIPQKKGVEF